MWLSLNRARSHLDNCEKQCGQSCLKFKYENKSDCNQIYQQSGPSLIDLGDCGFTCTVDEADDTAEGQSTAENRDMIKTINLLVVVILASFNKIFVFSAYSQEVLLVQSEIV